MGGGVHDEARGGVGRGRARLWGWEFRDDSGIKRAGGNIEVKAGWRFGERGEWLEILMIFRCYPLRCQIPPYF